MVRQDYRKQTTNKQHIIKKTTGILLVTIMLLALVISAGCVGNYEQKSISTGGIAGTDGAQYAAIQHDLASTPAPNIDVKNGVEFERKVITTSNIDLKVANVSGTMDVITEITLDSGGFISSSRINAYDSGEMGFMTIRIPQGYFEPVMTQLKTLGRVSNLETRGQDVTEEYIDLNARLNNFKSQETRLLEILNMTTTVEEVLGVERELGRVRGEIESITGRLKYLNNMVDLATININMRGAEQISSEFGIVASIKEAVSGFISTINFIIVLTGYLLPLVILLALLWALVKVWRRQ